MPKRLAIVMIAAALAGGCGLLKKDRPTTPVLGERVAVLASETSVEVDPATAALPMELPAPVANPDWTQPGGNAAKAMGHLALGDALGVAFTTVIGEGSGKQARLNSAPVVGDGRIYTIDVTSTVRAFDAQSGAPLWRTQFGTEKGNAASLFGGGVAFDQGRLFATNGLGFAAALDAASGRLVWQVRPGGPLRGAPTAVDGAVYAMSQDNQLYSLKAADGTTNWSNAAALEIAGVFGTASPAFAQGTVIAGFSSGELNAYRYENGRMVWQDTLSRTSISTSVASLSDIDAHPVVGDGRVYSVGQGGRMVALDLNSGQRLWELNIAGISTPWLAGEWLFVVTDDAKLLAIARGTGKIRWASQLPRYEKEKSKKGSIHYVGPVLAGNRLIVGGSSGVLINVNPANGAVINQTNVGSGVSFQPVVANSTLYVLGDSGRLVAYR